MNLFFCTAASNAAEWLAALSRALPLARLHSWPHCNGAKTMPPLENIDYALLWKPPPHLLQQLGSVKAIFNLGAGVDALAGIEAISSNVPVVRLEDAGMAEQMSEYVVHAVLRRYREFDAYAEAQRAAAWRPRVRLDKRTFGVGILGLGVLGSAVAAALKPFGFPLAAWSRTGKSVAGVDSYAGAVELDSFLARSRVLICLLPLTRETRGMLDRRTLSQLPAGAYLVNVSRGALIVDDDLLAMLDADGLAGAALDVFSDEPLPASHPFWHHPRISITPHVSAVTLVEESVSQIAGKIARLEAGLPITGIVGRDREY
ncbi:MAG TPA: glyoxylate/hydroxypyruvate reductase A [Casimicrobiaceae bacterium]